MGGRQLALGGGSGGGVGSFAAFLASFLASPAYRADAISHSTHS